VSRSGAGTGPLGPLAKSVLAAEIVATYARVRWAVRDRDVRVALRRLRDEPRERAGEPPADVPGCAARLARATSRTLPRLPARSRCLMHSLVLSSLLARRAIGSTLVIGVQPGERFGAHAWVELDGRPLLPPGAEEFPRLVEL
jgi:hypothetical protein